MAIDVLSALFRDHKAEAFLIVEEFHLAIDHRAGWATIAITEATATAEPVATTEAISAAETVTTAKAVTTTETITTAEPVAAPETISATKAISAAAEPIAPATAATWSTRRCRIRRRQIDAMHCRHLETARRILKIDHDCRALRHVLLSCCCKR